MSTAYNGSNAGPIADPITLPDDGDDADAASIGIPFQQLQDAAAFLKAHALFDTVGATAESLPNAANQGNVKFDGDVSILSGGTCTIKSVGVFTADAGSTVNINTALVAVDAAAVITCAAGAKVTGVLLFDASSIASFRGWTRLQDIEDLTDAGHTISATGNNQRLRMLTNPAAPRTIRVSETNAVAGDWFELTVLLGATGNPVQIERFNNPGTAIALLSITASGSPALNNIASVRIQFDGTNWRGSFAGMCCLYGGDW